MRGIVRFSCSRRKNCYQRTSQDVLSGFLSPISLNTSPRPGHLIMCDATRISSFG